MGYQSSKPICIPVARPPVSQYEHAYTLCNRCAFVLDLLSGCGSRTFLLCPTEPCGPSHFTAPLSGSGQQCTARGFVACLMVLLLELVVLVAHAVVTEEVLPEACLHDVFIYAEDSVLPEYTEHRR